MVVGIVQAAFGVLVIFVNYAENEHVGVLPGGHSELYLLLGLLIAGGSTWWFGWFDRPR